MSRWPRLASGRSANWALMEKFVVPHYDYPMDYLVRWRIFQTPWFGVYLHKLGTPDPRDTLHNHPWPFLSIVLRGGYTEFTQPFDCSPPGTYAVARQVRRFNVKRLKDWHWISALHRTPTWTLVLVGRRQRVWGYMDRDGTVTDFDKHHFNDEFFTALQRRKDEGRKDSRGSSY